MTDRLVFGRSFVSLGLAVFAGAALLAVSACNTATPSIVPYAAAYPASEQPMVESASHWQQIAAEIWDQVTGTLQANGFNETTMGLETPMPETQFTKALNNFLFTEAVSHGVTVSPGAQFTLSYTVQIINHEPLIDSPARESTTDNDGWDNNDTTTEMVLTISVTDGNSVRLRQSKVFYIDDANIGLYKVEKTSAESRISNSPLVSSNWYSANPHDVEPLARAEANSFSLIVDPANGPIRNVNAATPIAAAHCAKTGMAGAKYKGQSYPTNDRGQIKLTYECM